MYKKSDKTIGYERLINESPIFSLDKETEKIAYLKERTKMIEHLYNYLLSISKKYEPYGYEITEVAIFCIESFDSTKWEFLSYFYFWWKKKYPAIQLKEYQDNQYRGLHIPENVRRNIYQYTRYLKELGRDYDREELYSKLSITMQLPVDKIRKLAQLANVRVVGDTIKNDEGEEESIWNSVSDGVDIEKMFIEAEDKEELLDKMEKTFNSLQERQKPIVSDIMTIKLWLHLEEREKKYSFISKDVIKEWKKSGAFPTQRKIAEENERNEASVSRTVREFLQKVREEI